MIDLRERCRCGHHLTLWDSHGSFVVACYARCYDPSASDASDAELLCGEGATPEDALESYMTRREERDLEPVYTLSELARAVVPHNPPGTLRVITELFDTLAEAEPFAEAFTSSSNTPGIRDVWPPSPIFYEPATPKAANQ
jgi:hypothetical protein